MGVFKNDVGRPTNKTIIIRNILKGIGLLIVVGLAFGVGYYFNNQNKVQEKNKKGSDISCNANGNYDGLNFIVNNRMTSETMVTMEITSENSLRAFATAGNVDYESGKEYKVRGYGENPVALTVFAFNEAGTGLFAELTSDNDLYIGYYDEGATITFKKVETDKKIKSMTVVCENYGCDLYALTKEEKLYRVDVNIDYDEISNYNFKLDNLYEERTIEIADGTGLGGYITISKKTNKVDIYENKIAYNGKELKVNNIVTYGDDKNINIIFIDNNRKIYLYNSTWDKYNELYNYKNKKLSLSKYSDKKVKSITTNNYTKGYVYNTSENEVVTITYDDNTTETIKKDIYGTYNVKYKK